MPTSADSSRDPGIFALFRFAIELASWFAIGQAFGVLNLLVAFGLLTFFNVPGDKKFVGIAVSGPVRLFLETINALLGIYSTFLVWGDLWAGAFLIVWLVYLVLARRRLIWLGRGAK